MKIPIILNGEKTIIDANGDEKLLSVLRNLNLFSAKNGCEEGKCGYCTVLLDDRPVNSCLIPIGIIRDCSVVTLEFFKKTKDYEDIMKGFSQAGINLCGYCNASRILSVYALLKRVYRPSKEDLIEIANEIKCTCTDSSTFINGILFATANKHESEGRKKNV